MLINLILLRRFSYFLLNIYPRMVEGGRSGNRGGGTEPVRLRNIINETLNKVSISQMAVDAVQLWVFGREYFNKFILNNGFKMSSKIYSSSQPSGFEKEETKKTRSYKKALRQGSSLLSGWMVIACFLHKKYSTYLQQEAHDSHFSAPNPLQLSLS